MGYRIYLASIPNEKLDEIKNCKDTKSLYETINPGKSFEDLEEYDRYIGVYDIHNEVLHEFGKYIEWTSDLELECSSPIFLNENLNKQMCDEHDLYLINQKGLEYIISQYNDEMKTFYETRWALSLILQMLVDKEENLQKYKEGYKNSFNFIMNNEHSYLKLDMEDFFCIDFDNIFDKQNINKINSTIRFISSQLLSYFRSELQEYQNYKGEPKGSYNLDLDKPLHITDSWKKDKGILELTHIYKSFDWKNNSMYIYGF